MYKRETILTAIENIAKTITVANGYTYDVRLVSSQILPFEHIATTQFPAVFVQDLGDVEIEYKVGGIANVTIDLNIRVITKAEYSESQKKISNTDLDLVKAIQTSTTLSGLVSRITPLERESVDIETTYPYVAIDRSYRVVFSGIVDNGFN